MRWPSAWLVASSVVLIAGCGGSTARQKTPPPPKIPAAVARQLAGDADAVASGVGCAGNEAAAKLLQDITANVSRIPARYQEPLTSAANDLVARMPACAPPPKAKHEEHKPKPPKKHDHHKGHR